MAKKESTFLNMTATLLVVTVAAAFALGSVYNLTKEPIEKAKLEKQKAAIQKVVPAFDKLETKELKPETGNDMLLANYAYKNEELVGIAIETYTDKGFGGRVRIMVGFLPDASIYNTVVLEHKETPGLGDKMDAAKSNFPLQFNGKNPNAYKLSVKKDGGDVDAITAATISSRAFCDAIQRAYDVLKNNGDTLK